MDIAAINDTATQNPFLNEIANKVEQNILHGDVVYDKKLKKILYKPDKSDLTLELTETASMVSELAPLVVYIRHILQKDKANSLIIIEEPEAHLHPKVQVQLMEIFAELTKHIVKVILTSHSDFMFNKLSNMLLAKEIEPEKVAVYHMVMTEKGSEVLSDMNASEEGIEDHNFADVSADLYSERLNIYEELNEAQDAAQ